MKTTNLTKKDIAKRLMSNSQTPITLKQATLCVEETFMAITDALKAGNKVEIRGFGSFRTVERAARVGRNPRNPGKTYDIPSRRRVCFKPGLELKSTVV